MLEASTANITVSLWDGSQEALTIYPLSSEQARDLSSRAISPNLFYRFLKIVTRKDDEFLMQIRPICFFDILKAATSVLSPEVASQCGWFPEAPALNISMTFTR